MRRLSALWAVAWLGGCAAGDPSAPAPPSPAVAPVPAATARAFPGQLPASFSGTLPCADCPGLTLVVELYPGQVVVHRMRYAERGKEGGALDYDAMGRWRLTDDGRRLVLHVGREGPVQFEVTGPDAIDLLGVEGQRIESPFNHTLRRDVVFTPIEPQLFMVGMYSHLADASVFVECSTGWQLAVATEEDNAALERGYAASGVTPGEPVLVSLEGRIATRPSMEVGAPAQRTLVPVRFNRAWPDIACPSPAP